MPRSEHFTSNRLRADHHHLRGNLDPCIDYDIDTAFKARLGPFGPFVPVKSKRASSHPGFGLTERSAVRI